MDEFVPRRPLGPEGEKETTVYTDPLLQRRLETRRWEIRAAQWRVWALAEAVFGEGIHVGLGRGTGPGTFRGLLTLSVPFHDLDTHRRREAIFLRWASLDPVLARVPFIYVFQPLPVEAS